MRSGLLGPVGIAALIIAAAPLPTHAQGGPGEPPVYPGAVAASAAAGSAEIVVLSHDPLATVRAFFDKARRRAGVTEGAEKGERWVAYGVTISIEGGPPQSFNLVTVSERSGPDMNDPLYFLEKLVGSYGHTRADFDAVHGKYAPVARAYYREVETGDGGTVTEDHAIIEKHKRQILGPEPGDEVDEAEDAAAQKRADALQKKMDALEAKGDYAGMMALAKQAMAEESKSAAGQARERYVAAMEKDSWAAWIKCLDELKGAAFSTRIQYGPGPLGDW